MSSPHEVFNCSLKTQLPNLQFFLSVAQATLCPADYVFDVHGDDVNCLLMLRKANTSYEVHFGITFFLKYYAAFYLGDNPGIPYTGECHIISQEY